MLGALVFATALQLAPEQASLVQKADAPAVMDYFRGAATVAQADRAERRVFDPEISSRSQEASRAASWVTCQAQFSRLCTSAKDPGFARSICSIR